MKLIFDGMNIAYRSHYAFDKRQGLSRPDGMPTGMVFGFLTSLFTWRSRYPEHEFIVAWDGIRGTQHRKNIYAGYKEDRTSSEFTVDIDVESDNVPERIDAFSLQLWILKHMVRDVGITQVEGDYLEADDIIATLAKDTYKDDPVVIISSDHDLLQLVDSNTVQKTPDNKKLYDETKVKEEYGIRPTLLPMFRALTGDSSDGLPGLPYFRKKIAARLTRDHESLESLYMNLDEEDLTDKEFQKLEDFEDQTSINFELMDLSPVDPEEYRVDPGEYNESALESWFDFLGFGSGTADQIKALKPKGFMRYNDVLSRSPD